MDDRSRIQVESLWPDVAEPFAEIVPDGCCLAIAEDEWWAGQDARRRRRIALEPEPGSPSLEALLEEAELDAFREGWTPLDDGTHELENVRLSLKAEAGLLVVEFVQPWLPDVPPVETSEMFQNLVRKLLGLAADPVRLAKRLLVSRDKAMAADLLVESVEMPSPENLLKAFDRLGFAPPGETGGEWVSTEETETHRITAYVYKTKNWAQVRMEKRPLS